MTKYWEQTGRTEEEAIAAALAQLGMDRDDVSVEILERAKSGFLGIGSSPARVRLSWEAEDEPETVPAATPVQAAEKAEPVPAAEPVSVEPAPAAAVLEDENEEYAAVRSFLSGLLERMGVEAAIAISPRDDGGVMVNLSGPNMGAVIGRRGETLDAIQHLTNYAVSHNCDKHLRVSIDAEDYRAKREESLTKLAEKMAEKTIKYKRSMALEPMNSYERHVIHTALQNYEGVTTASTGTEPNRRVVISYVRTEQSSSGGNKPQSREWA